VRPAPRLALTLALAGSVLAGAQEAPPGGALYQKLCAQCHGERGDGRGIAAPRLMPPPRDFTAAKFKIRTTPSGALPTDADLLAVIREGMPYTSMPGWSHLSDAQLQELVAAVKSFSADFADPGRQPTPIRVPKAPAWTEASAEKGRAVYEEIGCGSCHGELGRGDGQSAPNLTDDAGVPIRPADLSKRWTFRGGPTREDIYRTFTTGMNGTPMPSFAESLSDEQRWQLVDYIASLEPSEDPGYDELLRVAWSDDELDLARGRELFAGAPPARFAVVGQVTEPGRAFHPSANGITVRGLYNRREIAFLLSWHDMRADRSGANAPDLRVPPEEESGTPMTPPATEEGFWGEAAAESEPSADEFWGEAAAESGEEEASADDFWGESDAPAATPAAATEFSDAVAIQLPVELPSGPRKPYFLFGDPQSPVDLWFVDLAGERARRYLASGSTAITAVEGEQVTAAAGYDRGEWWVILKRDARSAGGVPFVAEQFVPIAFSVWDGTVRERGNRRGLTQWKYAYTMPQSTPSPVWPMTRAALLVAALELGLVAWIRRRKTLEIREAEAHV
jgi:DMSO reductase family type II enzyme heme b subunit